MAADDSGALDLDAELALPENVAAMEMAKKSFKKFTAKFQQN